MPLRNSPLHKLDREALAQSIRSLPSFPAVVQQLTTLVRCPDVNFEQVADTVAMDQALAARVLQLANSPFYGRSGRIASIRDGINILGLRQLNGLVNAATITLEFEKLHGKSLGMAAFWHHSIACAAAARQIALPRGLDDAAAFTAGLLHDVGRLVLDSRFPTEMTRVAEWSSQRGLSPCEAERHLLGICHAEIGEWVSRHWRFTPDIVEAIALHHKPPPAGPVTLIDVVHAANALVHGLAPAPQGGPPPSPVIDPLSWVRLGLNAEAIDALRDQVVTECEGLLTALGVAKEGR